MWDLVGGGRLLRRLSNFQKTVTCVRMSPLAGPDSAAAPRMLAGSLDGHVKVSEESIVWQRLGQGHHLQLTHCLCVIELAIQIFELDTFKVTHSSKYPSPVLSMGISPDCKLLAVGMADGTLSIRQHDRPQVVRPDGSISVAAPGDQGRGRRRGVRLNASNYRYFIRGQNEKAAAHDHRVVARRKAKLQPYDLMLRQFRCG